MTSIRGLSWPFLASIGACLIMAAPLWCVASPAMPDYPAHLASFYLIGGGASHFYRVQWAFLPNLAAEALVPALANFLPLDVAVKTFLSLTISLWVLGPAAIQRALFGRIGPSALLAVPFTYNAPFLWGFFNYTFATGLSFVVLAAWIATDEKRHAPQLAGFAVAFTVIYFSHLFALATLLLMILSFEAGSTWQSQNFTMRAVLKRTVTLALLCLPAALCFLYLRPGGDGLNVKFELFDTLVERFEAAIQFQFDQPAYVLSGALVALFIAGILTKHLRVPRRMWLVLLALGLCTTFMPEWALGGWGVHLRLPAVLGVVAFASTEFELAQRWLQAAVVGLLALFAFQASTLAGEWTRIDARYSEFLHAETTIRQQARLLTVLDGDSLGWSSDQPYWHMAEFAVIDRDVFTPLLFATKGQHVIQVLPPMDRYAAVTAQQGSPPDIDELDDLAAGNIDADEDIRDVLPYLLFFQCHFDQAVVIHGEGPLSRVPQMLRLRHTGSFYALYDIVPDKRCSGR